MGAYGFNEIEIVQFFASLMRVTFLFMLLPIFGDNTVPGVVRVFLAFTVNLIVFPTAAAGPAAASVASAASSDLGLLSLALREAGVGLFMGFTAKIFFEGLAFAFGHLGTQMGFNMASVYDTHTENSVPVISHMIMIFTMLLFLAADGHHLFVKALVQSYDAVPLGAFNLTREALAHVLETSAQVFWIAVKLSAPMALMLFLVNCAFGIVSKAVPQINVLVVSFTVNILVGFVVIALTLPVLGTSVNEVFEAMMARMNDLMRILA